MKLRGKYMLTFGKWEIGLVWCGTWHWSIKTFKSWGPYWELDWGYWLFFIGKEC